MLEYATDDGLIVHKFLLVVAWNGDSSVQYHIVEHVWQIWCILSFAIIWFLALLPECVPEVEEESDQEVYAWWADLAVENCQEYAEDLAYG